GRPLFQVVARTIADPLVREKRIRGLIDVRVADLPRIQDLQRRFAGAMTQILANRAHGALPRLRCCATTAISMAAAAASHPLLDGSSAARSSASSTEFVVSTPNAMGTPVAADADVSPCATAAAMKSKCGVAPRTRQPRHTTASNCCVFAAR